MQSDALAGRRVLVVEDEYLLAAEVVKDIRALGAEVIGPVATVDDALDLLAETERLDAALLDLNLCGEMAFPIADALMERGVPFVFATGYDRFAIPPRYAAVRRFEKPVDIRALAGLLSGAGQSVDADAACPPPHSG
jgi:DNA-binding LytR/AlgR family response regulator